MSQPGRALPAGAHGCVSRRDVKCGTLLCLSDNTQPILGSGYYSFGYYFGRFKCKAVIAGNDAGEAAELRLVPTGAKCGEEMVRAVRGRAGPGEGERRPRGSLRAPLPAPRSATPGAARTCWSTATRTARPSATTTGYALGSPRSQSRCGPRPHRHHPDALPPPPRCATTGANVTATPAGQRPTASRRFRG